MRPWTSVATMPMRRGWRCGARALRRGEARPHRGLCWVAPSEYELSVGKIADTLQKDYPAIFEQEPDFGVYQKHVLLALGQPFNVKKVVDYRTALSSLLWLGKAFVKDGKVFCQVCDGEKYGCALRVYWRCDGIVKWGCIWTPLNISAVSLYSVDREVPCADENGPPLAYRISRHVIEFTEINPPTIRSLLRNLWWRFQVDHREPVLALKPVPSLNAGVSLPSDAELYSAACSSAEELRRSYCFGGSAHCYTPPPPTVTGPVAWSLFAS